MATVESPAAVAEALSDDVLVERCRQRDEAAVRALTTRYNQRLFRLARGIVRNDADAEDVVQETYVRAFIGLDRFRGEANVGTWLTRIAINEALGRLRRRRPTVDLDTVPIPSSDAGTDPESVMTQHNLRALLERSIDKLPDPFRVVFMARMVEGLSVEETADLLGLRPETVKTRVHRARARLRASIEQEVGSSATSAFAFDGERCRRTTDAVIKRLSRSQHTGT